MESGFNLSVCLSVCLSACLSALVDVWTPHFGGWPLGLRWTCIVAYLIESITFSFSYVLGFGNMPLGSQLMEAVRIWKVLQMYLCSFVAERTIIIQLQSLGRCNRRRKSMCVTCARCNVIKYLFRAHSGYLHGGKSMCNSCTRYNVIKYLYSAAFSRYLLRQKSMCISWTRCNVIKYLYNPAFSRIYSDKRVCVSVEPDVM